jgi:hypothetical protein
MYGAYYRVPGVIDTHVRANAWVNGPAMEATTLGRDVSAMFFKADRWELWCELPRPPGGDWDPLSPLRRTVPEQAMSVWMFHRGREGGSGRARDYVGAMAPARRGFLARDGGWISGFLAEDPVGARLIMAYGRIYDVSTYLDATNRNNFLGDNMRRLILAVGRSGQDATRQLEEIKRLEGRDQVGDFFS